MRRITAFCLAAVMALSISSSAAAAATKAKATPTPKPSPAASAEQKENVWDDENVLFTKEVRNDKTGNWRVAVIYSALIPADHALDYYKKYFEDDHELHFICNLGLKTTTKLQVFGSTMYVDVYEYYPKEEHDAKILPGGMKLASYIIDMETGETEKLD